MLTTPVDRIRCSLVGELRVPARASSLSVQPSPLSWRVGVHITTFEACSSFTRVTACRVAHPPSVGFIARLRPGRFPGSDARKLPSSTNNLLGWVLPPLVIYAVEAHTITPCIVPNPGETSHIETSDQLITTFAETSVGCRTNARVDAVRPLNRHGLNSRTARDSGVPVVPLVFNTMYDEALPGL